MTSDYKNRPLDGILSWVLVSVGLIIADYFCCIGVQAFMDHVLKSESFIVAALVSHTLCGAGLWVLVRLLASERQTHFRMLLLAWILTSPAILLMSFVIDFRNHFVF